MAGVTLNPTKFAIIQNLNSYNDHTSAEMHFHDRFDEDIINHYQYLLIGGFPAISTTYKRKRFLGAWLYAWICREYNSSNPVAGFWAHALAEDFNANTVTWYTKPNYDNNGYNIISEDKTNAYPVFLVAGAKVESVTQLNNIDVVKNIVAHGLEISAKSYTDYIGYGVIKTPAAPSVNATRLEIAFYDDDNGFRITFPNPDMGYVPKHKASTFNWSVTKKGESLEDVTITKMGFRWRVKGAETYTEYECEQDASGYKAEYTVPADTFTTDYIEWTPVIYDSFGNTTIAEKGWSELNTIEYSSRAVADYPKSIIVDSSVPNTFKWQHIISTGTDATRSDLQISDDGITFEDFATVIGSALTYEAPAYSITAGNKYWRVRTYNGDNVAGAWSEAVSFIALGQPVLQGVTVNATPRPTISWQSDDFKGYQVKIDNTDYGIYYGTEYSFKSPVYLDDGEHTAQVRIINQFGMWSSWQTAAFTVTNTTETPIQLTAYSDNSIANLSWNTGYDEYIVYRDKKAIAKTDGTIYKDYFAVGNHEYFVRGISNGSDYYGKSNTVGIEILVDFPIITDVKTKQWISLKHSTQSIETVSFNIQTLSNTRHYSSAVYPLAELSKQKSISVNGRTAFKSNVDALEFEKLIGKVVCYKAQDIAVVGLLASQSKRKTTFFTEYDFNIVQTEFSEDVEL